MADGKIRAIVTETITLVTADLQQAVNVPEGATGVEVRGTGASPPTFQFTPRMQSAWWFDSSATPQYISVVDELTERGTTRFAEIDSFATADFLYFGCDVPFLGLWVNILAANGTTSTATVEYDVSGTWTDISDTDGTASGGATLAVDDVISWTMPTDWTQSEVNDVTMFWVRFSVSVQLDSDTRIAEVIPLSAQSNQPLSIVTVVVPPPRYWFSPGDVGGIEASAHDGDTLVLNWLITGKSRIAAAR